MSTENIDTMGFEPAVEYDVPEFGKVRVLMKDGEPWFKATDLGQVIRPETPNTFASFVSSREDVRSKSIRLSRGAAAMLFSASRNKMGRFGAWVVSLEGLKAAATQPLRGPRTIYPEKLKKFLPWAEKNFKKKEEKLSYAVKFNDLEVVFYKGNPFVTAPSLRKTAGSHHTGGMFSFGDKCNQKGLVKISNIEAVNIGINAGGTGSRILITFRRAEEYLKNVCDNPSRFIICDWLVNTVEPAAKKHLEALKAQEKAEAEARARAAEVAKKAAAAKPEPKPAKEETPLLLNAETVPPAAVPSAPASLSYDELLSSWRVTMKAQEATLKEREAILKELEAAKKDLASRIARIDEQNADIETLVKQSNDFQAERRKLKEEIEAAEKEIEALKNGISNRNKHIKELEDKVAYQIGLLGRAGVRLQDYEELHSLVSNLLEIHRGNDHDDMECYANIKGLCAAFEEWRSGYEAECEEAGSIGNRLLNATLGKQALEKQLAAAKAALVAKEAELTQANAKLKEAEEKAECEHNNCDAILAELKAEREAKKALIAKYRDTVSENDFLLKNLSDRCALKLVPPYLPPMPLHKAKEL